MLMITPEIKIPDAELEFTFSRSSGPGGQNVNKVNSKALLRWCIYTSTIPYAVRARFLQRFKTKVSTQGDVLIVSDRFRDRGQNQRDCLEKLKQMLLMVAEAPKPRKKTKPSRTSKEERKVTKRKQSTIKKFRKKPSLND